MSAAGDREGLDRVGGYGGNGGDVYDILTGTPMRRAKAVPLAGRGGGGEGGETNVFSVVAARGEEKRARVFLERVKNVVEGEPGRLIL